MTAMAGRVRVVLQSRLSSSRLPAKGLLPLAGTTVVALAARRAANSGLDVLVATSEDPTDDPLAEHLAQGGVTFMRGPLDDVLGRFEQATRDLADDDVVVRLTADNVLPDGPFIEELVRARAERAVTYLATRWPLDGLPHGLAAEVFTVASLRVAANTATLPFDREHVTPWIERTHGTPIFRPAFAGASMVHLRCTLDTLPDYSRLFRLFRDVSDPIAIPAAALVARLAGLPGEPAFRVPFRVVGDAIHGALVLDGTELLRAKSAQARRLVATALTYGVTCVEAEGASDLLGSRLGAALPVGFSGQAWLSVRLDLGGRQDAAALDVAVLDACHAVGRQSLEAIVVSDLGLLAASNGAVWERLMRLQALGTIGRIGVSVSTPEQCRLALQHSGVDQLRLVLGGGASELQAFGQSDLGARLAERPGMVVHASSQRLDAALVRGGARSEQAQSALSELLALDWITGVVASASDEQQLADLLALFRGARHGEQR
jgi:spore coat polysaccharide biosynthesis protein SpsF (cytidylyltransferase family)